MNDFRCAARPNFLCRGDGLFASALTKLFNWMTEPEKTDEPTLSIKRSELKEIVFPVAKQLHFHVKTYHFNREFDNVSLSDLRALHGIAEVARTNPKLTKKQNEKITQFLNIFNFNRLFPNTVAPSEPNP